MGARCSPPTLVLVGESLRVTQRRPGNQFGNSKDFFLANLQLVFYVYPNIF